MGFAIGGAIAVGAGVGYLSSQNAANTESNAANNATVAQTNINNQNQANEAPWNAAGQTALGQLQSGNIVPGMTNANGTNVTGDRGFNPLAASDPGYQFRLNQGTMALNASAAARGEADGGAQAKALDRYNQDYATNEYNNVYNQNYTRLAQIAGFGQAAVAGGVASNLTTGADIGSNTMGAANAQAAGSIATGNNVASAIGSGTNAWTNYGLLNKLTAPSTTTTAGTTPTYNSYPASGSTNGYLGANTTFNYPNQSFGSN